MKKKQDNKAKPGAADVVSIRLKGGSPANVHGVGLMKAGEGREGPRSVAETLLRSSRIEEVEGNARGKAAEEITDGGEG